MLLCASTPTSSILSTPLSPWSHTAFRCTSASSSSSGSVCRLCSPSVVSTRMTTSVCGGASWALATPGPMPGVPKFRPSTRIFPPALLKAVLCVKSCVGKGRREFLSHFYSINAMKKRCAISKV
ncbi:Hypothetical protein, putative [Bodo saltans]|uniref:Uncharacterized protein n=1 Tax=Bodo saltans TaxID=75058 RepID=A0A0S4IW99_BODSA|nr:Hypothetical protein, putative [Bodo saltans]|eukprot:CUG06176.1 Hypothetical protein, putative [Bodo saltans]